MDPNAQKTSDSPKSKKSRFSSFLLLLAGILPLLYFYYIHSKNNVIAFNQNYFRIVSEAAEKTDRKVEQFKRLLENGATVEKIQLYFPSFRNKSEPNKENEDKCETANKKEQEDIIKINGIDVLFTNYSCQYNSVTISDEDFIAQPSAGLSHFLIVDSANKVVAINGSDKELTILDATDISNRIQADLNKDWIKLTNTKITNTGSKDKPATRLPGHNYTLDINLNPGNYRAFILPLKLYNSFESNNAEGAETSNTAKINRFLYSTAGETKPTYHLIGILPKQYIKTVGGEHRKIAFFFGSLIVFAFILEMFRLFLSSTHTPVNAIFYKTTIASSYLLFALIITLIISFSEAQQEKHNKTLAAKALAINTSDQLKHNIVNILEQLEYHQGFYQCLIQQNSSNIKECLDRSKDKIGRHWWLEPGSYTSYFKKQSKFHKLNDLASNGFNVTDCTTSACVELFGQNIVHYSSPKKTPVQQYYKSSKTYKNPESAYLQSVFLMNSSGIQIAPKFKYIEDNAYPAYFKLSHREYYKRAIHDDLWSLPEQLHLQEAYAKREFYIQRLRNIIDGVLGTTISIPLASNSIGSKDPNFYILGADIKIPNLSEPIEINPQTIQDMRLMLVDRTNGDVIFHWDDNRVLTENFYQSARGSEKLRHILTTGQDICDLQKAKLDCETTKNHTQGLKASDVTQVDGVYHGYRGKFLIKQTIIQDWAIVIFFPDESVETYFSNLFIILMTAFVLSFTFIYLALSLLRVTIGTGKIKRRLHIPLALNRRKFMLFVSVCLAFNLAGSWLAHNYSVSNHQISLSVLLLIPFLVNAACFTLGSICYLIICKNSKTIDNTQERKSPNKQ